MTTRITVEANHGWPVRVSSTDPVTGRKWPERIVPPAAKETFYVHSNADLHIHEIQPGEGTASDEPDEDGLAPDAA